MVQIIITELHRAFYNKNFLYAILIGSFVCVTHVIQNVIPLVPALNSYAFEYPFSLFNTWIGGNSSNLQTAIYFFLIPIIGTIPHAHSLQYDLHQKFATQLLIHTKKSYYLVAKIIATWLSAGCAIVIPLILNLLLTALFMPAVIPEASSLTFGIFELSMWSNLFYSHPFVYILGYLLIIFTFGGLFCCTALLTSLFTENKFAVILTPFLFFILIYFLVALFFDASYNPMFIMYPSQPLAINIKTILFEFLTLLVIIFPIYFIRGMRCEIF